MSHPAIRLIGIGRASDGGDEATATSDSARDHDEILAASEEASWREVPGDDESGGRAPRASRPGEPDAG